MNFISVSFLLFFAIVLSIYWKISERKRPILLLIVSYFFYWYLNKWVIVLLLFTTVFSYAAARKMAEQSKVSVRRKWLIATLCASLGSLFIFKYLGFFSLNLTRVLQRANLSNDVFAVHIILPVGISFYTFQTLSYVIDVYKKKEKVEKSFVYYALFVSFFPQLVAGPIERPGNLLPQLHKHQKFDRYDLLAGGLYMLRGFYKKLVVADFLASYVDQIYGHVARSNGPGVVIGTVFFAIQIYCDFSGYSDIAVGTARMMGISLIQNFREPYSAVSIRDFWHRWHISLTSWLTDYVYKPLGGSYRGQYYQVRNIVIVFLLSGLWHGAAWHYVLWGGIHGIYLIISILIRKRVRLQNLPEHLRKAITFALVCVAWIFFRADSVSEAFCMIGRLSTGWSVNGLLQLIEQTGMNLSVMFYIIMSLICLYLMRRIHIEKIGKRIRCANQAELSQEIYISYALVIFCFLIIIMLAWIFLLSTQVENSFIYFQF